MARGIPNMSNSLAPAPNERCLAMLSEVLEDIRAQVYSSHPQLAQLVQIAERLASAAVLRPEELQDVLAELRNYERQHLSGHERYTRILREPRNDAAQMRWEW